MTSEHEDANEAAHRVVREATGQPTDEPPRCNKPVLLGAQTLRCFLEPGHLGPCQGV